MRAAIATGEARPLPIGVSLSRTVAVLGGGGLLLVALLLVAVAVGSANVGIGDTAAILGRRLLALPIPQTWSAAAETIIFEIRLPRVLTAMLVGGGLALAGSVFQALLRNPLADPYVIGTAAGASLGAALGIAAPLVLQSVPAAPCWG
jgi:iron complex transport system permease protein